MIHYLLLILHLTRFPVEPKKLVIHFLQQQLIKNVPIHPVHQLVAEYQQATVYEARLQEACFFIF